MLYCPRAGPVRNDEWCVPSGWHRLGFSGSALPHSASKNVLFSCGAEASLIVIPDFCISKAGERHITPMTTRLKSVCVQAQVQDNSELLYLFHQGCEQPVVSDLLDAVPGKDGIKGPVWSSIVVSPSCILLYSGAEARICTPILTTTLNPHALWFKICPCHRSHHWCAASLWQQWVG